mmetsp:Transcript_62204/g.138898  ORF Transcript_62204/g.138898 Transcript_62204/m.138898 type:complete len:206 (-) Transcript_62204:14-631(-)
MAKHQDQATAQFASGKLQAPNEAAFRVRAGIASIAQHEDVAGHGVEDLLQWCAAVRTADDGSVWGLPLLNQHLAHLVVRPDGLRHASHETAVAFLEHAQGLGGRDLCGCGSAHARAAGARVALDDRRPADGRLLVDDWSGSRRGRDHVLDNAHLRRDLGWNNVAHRHSSLRNPSRHRGTVSDVALRLRHGWVFVEAGLRLSFKRA